LNAEAYKGFGPGALMFEDSALTERQNIPIQRLSAAAAHMNQFTLLWRLNIMFRRQNAKKSWKQV
jgi:hypothetical protein